MSFKLFIYYCALCGGWAAFLAWAVLAATGLRGQISPYLWSPLTGGLVGLLVAVAIGSADALLNAVGWQRFVRVLVCLGVGLFGGLFGALVGEVLHSALHVPVVFGWVLVGICIGGSVGVFDWLRAVVRGEDQHAARKKTLNGVCGGSLGGFLGGLPFGFLLGTATIPRSDLVISLVILGLCIGLFIGMAQVFLREAWLKVERGFRAGRELLLAKDETTIGRAEDSDLGLFGDSTIERLHARILLRQNRYVLADADTPNGTYLNEQRIHQPTPLHSGDRIRVGNSVIEFGERQKRKEVP